MGIAGRVTSFGSPGMFLVTFAALDVSVGQYLRVSGVNGLSTIMLLLSVGAFVLAVVAGGRPAASVQPALLILLAAQLVFRVLVPFRPEMPDPAPVFQAIGLAALVALGAGTIRGRRVAGPRWLTACIALVVILGVLSRFAIVVADVRPTFDVPLIQEAAAAAIRGGTDPYLTHVYASGYPYLPVAAIGATLGSLFGDARWVMVAGDVMTILGLLLIGRRLGLPPLLGMSTAAVWAWWMGGMYVTWQGFPEPLLIGLLTLSVAALVGSPRRGILGGVLLGLSVATKQFAVALLPFLLVSRHGRRAFVIAVLTALVVTAPFALWHPHEFLEGTFWSLLREPGREFSLNLLVWPGGRLDPPYLPILFLGLVVGWLVTRRFGGVDSDAAWLAGSATLLLIAFLANRIAFVNYYAILMLVLLLLAMVLSPERRAWRPEVTTR